jgi:SAM-dependent methyltransferase
MDATTLQLTADVSAEDYRATRAAHWDALATKRGKGLRLGGGYHRCLADIYRFLIPSGQRVLELGCGDGRLLAALQPACGVGVDFASGMVERGRALHPELEFHCGDVHQLDELDLEGPFDFIILSDLVNDLWDVQAVLNQVARVAGPRTRVILNTFSHAWSAPLRLASRLRLIEPRQKQNWLTVEDQVGLLRLSGFEVVRHWKDILWPVWTPLVGRFCNRFLAKLFPFRYFDLTNFIIARPDAAPPERDEPTVSVIVPARNEAGNIRGIIERTPLMGARTELIFVEGHSSDNTYQAIEEAIADHPERDAILLRQEGKGKGDAVRLGFEKATGDILMILDADLSVAPEELTRFYDAIRNNKAEFVNGVRLVYPMENRAMRFFNLLGNKFFSVAFSWLLGSSVKDTLCGTKVLWKRDYERIAANRAYFGDFDPFGDFDLLFGAAKLNLRIVDVPIRYRERKYGATNIQRWRHGWMLLNMVLFAACKIKFI